MGERGELRERCCRRIRVACRLVHSFARGHKLRLHLGDDCLAELAGVGQQCRRALQAVGTQRVQRGEGGGSLLRLRRRGLKELPQSGARLGQPLLDLCAQSDQQTEVEPTARDDLVDTECFVHVCHTLDLEQGYVADVRRKRRKPMAFAAPFVHCRTCPSAKLAGLLADTTLAASVNAASLRLTDTVTGVVVCVAKVLVERLEGSTGGTLAELYVLQVQLLDASAHKGRGVMKVGVDPRARRQLCKSFPVGHRARQQLEVAQLPLAALLGAR
eukprot:scaffold42343_cov75-Phaeocystis_antarctica.AAC.3